MTQNCGLDQYGAGYSLGQVAAQWMNKNQGGTGEWALLAITNDPQLLLRGKGAAAAMKKFAPNAKLVEHAVRAARDAGRVGRVELPPGEPEPEDDPVRRRRPGLRCVHLGDRLGQDGATDFFIGSCDGTNEALSKIAQGGIYQATSDFLFPFSATQLERDAEKFWRKQPIQPTRITTPITVTAQNLKSVQAMSEEPARPERAVRLQEVHEVQQLQAEDERAVRSRVQVDVAIDARGGAGAVRAAAHLCEPGSTPQPCRSHTSRSLRWRHQVLRRCPGARTTSRSTSMPASASAWSATTARARARS